MRFFLADTGLVGELGHHANSCRHIAAAMKARGIPFTVLAHKGVAATLRVDMGAVPWFQCHTYTTYDRDPICGWLRNFELVAQAMQADLDRIGPLRRDDILYVNSAQAAQFMGTIRWFKRQPAESRPLVAMEFGAQCGLEAVRTATGLEYRVPDPRTDCRAPFFRFAASLLTPEDQPHFRLATFDPMASRVYQMLLNYPVATLPLPHGAVTDGHSRVGRRPVTVAVLGHQRPDKGYDLVPDLAARLLAARADIRLLIHNGEPKAMPRPQEAIRALATGEPRLEVNEQIAGPALWRDLLDRSDLILCPYEQSRFTSSYSAIVAEALANAIPLVVPAATTLAERVAEFGGAGTTFETRDIDPILGATLAAIDDFDTLAERATQAARRWTETQGADRFVATLAAWQTATGAAEREGARAL